MPEDGELRQWRPDFVENTQGACTAGGILRCPEHALTCSQTVQTHVCTLSVPLCLVGARLYQEVGQKPEELAKSLQDVPEATPEPLQDAVGQKDTDARKRPAPPSKTSSKKRQKVSKEGCNSQEKDAGSDDDDKDEDNKKGGDGLACEGEGEEEGEEEEEEVDEEVDPEPIRKKPSAARAAKIFKKPAQAAEAQPAAEQSNGGQPGEEEGEDGQKDEEAADEAAPNPIRRRPASAQEAKILKKPSQSEHAKPATANTDAEEPEEKGEDEEEEEEEDDEEVELGATQAAGAKKKPAAAGLFNAGKPVVLKKPAAATGDTMKDVAKSAQRSEEYENEGEEEEDPDANDPEVQPDEDHSCGRREDSPPRLLKFATKFFGGDDSMAGPSTQTPAKKQHGDAKTTPRKHLSVYEHMSKIALKLQSSTPDKANTTRQKKIDANTAKTPVYKLTTATLQSYVQMRDNEGKWRLLIAISVKQSADHKVLASKLLEYAEKNGPNKEDLKIYRNKLCSK